MTYYCEHNICPMTTRLPAQSDTIVVHKDVHLEQIAGVLGIDTDMLRTLNPEFRRDIVPGSTKAYPIRLPLADTGRFIDMEDSIYNYRASELLTKRAIVDVADDVPTFSRKSKGRSSRYSRNAKRSRRGGSGRGGRNITIRKGQTLSQIAKANGTTVAKLKRLNGIKGNNIRAGKKLRVK